MPSKSKAKGNSFERELSKTLNEIYSTTEFARTPSSGAIMGRSNFGRNAGLADSVKTTLGSDLIVPEWFKFSVEAKSYKDSPNFSQIIKGDDSDLTQWIAECVYDANNFKLTPLLFFKVNRKGTYCALPAHFKDSLKLSHYTIYNEMIIFGLEQFKDNKEVIKRGGEVLRSVSIDWLLRSQYTQGLIQHIDTQNQKKTKPKKSTPIKSESITPVETQQL